MKHIVKREPPHELRQWINGQPVVDGRRINCGYSDMPGDVRRIIIQCLLAEQGSICCYTGIRIDEQRSHVEHLKPQRLCSEGEGVDYTNLLAAYPEAGKRCKFGAVAKSDWYDTEMVDPLHNTCERRFVFNQFGRMSSSNADDLAARETISRLHLDHELLVQMRKQAIDSALMRRGKVRSEAQLRRLAEDYCTRDADGRYSPFCFAVSQAAQAFLAKVERRRKGKQYSRDPQR